MIKDFIEQMQNKGYVTEDVEFFVGIKNLYEKQNGKSVSKFNIDTVNTMLSLLSPGEEIQEKRLINLLVDYLEWIQEEPSFEIEKVRITKSVYLVEKDKIPTTEMILEDVRLLDNPLDKVTLVLPYYGIGGTGMSELLDIRNKDIDYYRNQVSVYKKRIDPTHKIIVDLPVEVIQWMKEAISYYEEGNIRFVKDDYLIKRRVGTKKDDRERRVKERLIRINKRLDTEYTFTTLRQFGIINAFKDSVREHGVPLETLLSTEPGREIMTQYSYPAQRKTILIKKYKQYVD